MIKLNDDSSVDTRAEESSATTMPTLEAFRDVVSRANAGDERARADLKQLLDENECIWQQVGDLGQAAEIALIEVMAGGNELLRESLTRSAHALRDDLLGDHPTAIEKICIERIVANYLETQWTAAKYPEPTGDLRLAKFILSRKDSAERRLHASIKSLSLVRKLAPPAPAKPARAKKKRRKKKSKMIGSTARSAVAAGGPVNRMGGLLIPN